MLLFSSTALSQLLRSFAWGVFYTPSTCNHQPALWQGQAVHPCQKQFQCTDLKAALKTSSARLTCNLLRRARQSSCKLLTDTSIRLNILQMQFKHIRVLWKKTALKHTEQRQKWTHPAGSTPCRGLTAPLHNSDGISGSHRQAPSLPSSTWWQASGAQAVGGCGSSPSHAIGATAGVSFSRSEVRPLKRWWGKSQMQTW